MTQKQNIFEIHVRFKAHQDVVPAFMRDLDSALESAYSKNPVEHIALVQPERIDIPDPSEDPSISKQELVNKYGAACRQAIDHAILAFTEGLTRADIPAIELVPGMIGILKANLKYHFSEMDPTKRKELKREFERSFEAGFRAQMKEITGKGWET